MTERLGVTIGLEGGALANELSLCAGAIELGYTDIWSAEAGAADAFSPLAAVARVGGDARLGTAIVPAFTRPPALLAMSAATMQNLTEGRFILGLGTSSSIIVQKWMGQSFAKPLARLRETVEVLRDLFAGKKVTSLDTSFQIRDFRLQLDPSAPIPIYLAALGPRACRLAGEVADGVIFFLKTPHGVRQALDWVAQGARAAGRDPTELDCVIRLPIAVDEDRDLLAAALRRFLVTYAMVDVYNGSLAQQGFADEATGIVKAWRAGERDRAASSVTDEMLDQLTIAGDVEMCKVKLQAFRAAGVDTPVVLPMSVAPDAEERRRRLEQAVSGMAPRPA